MAKAVGALQLADAGCDTRDIQAVLGHRTTAMSDHYAKDADRKRRAASAIAKLERAGNRESDELSSRLSKIAPDSPSPETKKPVKSLT